MGTIHPYRVILDRREIGKEETSLSDMMRRGKIRESRTPSRAGRCGVSMGKRATSTAASTCYSPSTCK